MTEIDREIYQMKGLFFTGDSVVETRDVMMPSPGEGEVVLKMKSSGICGSDLGNFKTPKAENFQQEIFFPSLQIRLLYDVWSNGRTHPYK